MLWLVFLNHYYCDCKCHLLKDNDAVIHSNGKNFPNQRIDGLSCTCSNQVFLMSKNPANRNAVGNSATWQPSQVDSRARSS